MSLDGLLSKDCAGKFRFSGLLFSLLNIFRINVFIYILPKFIF